MHVQTHIMSGWCIANLFRVTPGERLLAMVAASVADVDGLGIILGTEYYADYHHVLAHNLAFGFVAALTLAAFSNSGLKAFCLYLGLFHLHLVLDYFGSGPGWGIYYLWPFSKVEIVNPRAWAFFSWQNLTAAGIFLGWIYAIIRRQRRTPLELIMPSLDRQIVDKLAKTA